jgi:hypothetical protein
VNNGDKMKQIYRIQKTVWEADPTLLSSSEIPHGFERPKHKTKSLSPALFMFFAFYGHGLGVGKKRTIYIYFLFQGSEHLTFLFFLCNHSSNKCLTNLNMQQRKMDPG